MLLWLKLNDKLGKAFIPGEVRCIHNVRSRSLDPYLDLSLRPRIERSRIKAPRDADYRHIHRSN